MASSAYSGGILSKAVIRAAASGRWRLLPSAVHRGTISVSLVGARMRRGDEATPLLIFLGDPF